MTATNMCSNFGEFRCSPPGGVIKVREKDDALFMMNNQTEQLSLKVVDENDPSLTGWDWLSKIKLDWIKPHQILSFSGLERILDKQNSLFKRGSNISRVSKLKST